MNTNVNFAAPLGAMAFLGTGLVLVVIGLTIIYSLAVRKFGLAKIVTIGMLVIAAVYLSAILIFSLASSEKVLARGQEKHFCEIDCHLAYSIADIKQTKTIGKAPNQATANGAFALVTIKTRFDETTISSTRGNGSLYPNSRALTVVDEQGRKYSPSPEGLKALELAGAAGTPIQTPLRPSESYTTTVAFDLPVDVRSPTLLINEGEWNTYLVIGHENSLLHKKTRFQIDLPAMPLERK
jgi:uncharacterized protein involved in high-affinity Fe2+ transport